MDKEAKMKTNMMVVIPSLLIGLWFFIVPLVTKANVTKDSIQQKHALNDPRNPNCPCHKYQKLADDEFKKQMVENKKALLPSKSGEQRLSLARQNWIPNWKKTRTLTNKKGKKAWRKVKTNTNCFHF